MHQKKEPKGSFFVYWGDASCWVVVLMHWCCAGACFVELAALWGIVALSPGSYSMMEFKTELAMLITMLAMNALPNDAI